MEEMITIPYSKYLLLTKGIDFDQVDRLKREIELLEKEIRFLKESKHNRIISDKYILTIHENRYDELCNFKNKHDELLRYIRDHYLFDAILLSSFQVTACDLLSIFKDIEKDWKTDVDKLKSEIEALRNKKSFLNKVCDVCRNIFRTLPKPF